MSGNSVVKHSCIVASFLAILTLLLNITASPHASASTTVSINTAGSKRVSVESNAWGRVSGGKAGWRVWTEVWVKDHWSRSQQRRTTVGGGYVIPLTYGAKTPGTYSFRVAAELPNHTIVRSKSTQFHRAKAPTLSTAGTKPINQSTYGWGTFDPQGLRKVVIQALVKGHWSQSREGRASASGYYALPLTYGADTPGSYRFRAVGVYAHHYDVSPERTLKRVGPSRTNCAAVKCVALTFDDGPGPYTERLLNILHSKGVHATFFLVGNRVDGRRSTVHRMSVEGNQVGNHSWTHADLSKLSARQILDQVNSTDAAIRRATGHGAQMMRPPYGGLNSTVRATLSGYPAGQMILWSIDTLDWKTRSAAATLSAVKQQVNPGSIILMHDIHSSTVDAVPGIIDYLKSSGYHLVTVEELLAGRNPRPGHAYSHR